MLKMNQAGTTIFLTTHYMEEVENFCEHVAIMKQGSLLAYGTVAELEEKTKTTSLNDVFLVLTNRDGVDDRQRAICLKVSAAIMLPVVRRLKL